MRRADPTAPDPQPKSATTRRRSDVAAVKETAEQLGNTAAVCRSSCIDPRVIDHFEEGRTIAHHGWSPGEGDTERLRPMAETALLAMLADAEGRAAA